MDLSQCNPTGRFTGLADCYQRHRPSYPAAAIDLVLARCGLGPTTLLADVGCGTGISSRLFAARGVPVVGIEPNDEMRQRAEQVAAEPGWAKLEYRAGQAEATGLPDASVAAVLAAQAFHWFDPQRALGEFHRVLRPGGWVALMWYERDESDPFTAGYGDLLRRHSDASAVEAKRLRAGEAVLLCPLYEERGRHDLTSSQDLDEDGLVGRAFSASYVPQKGPAASALETDLRQLFRNAQLQGQVVLRYQTSVYLGRKKVE
jgi:ubiquinone/menaquinone biosynthesis C-methylase UbiE